MRCHPYQRSAAARSHLQYTQGKSMSHHVPETMPDFVSSPRTSVSLNVVGELLPLPNNFHYLSKVCAGDTRVGVIMCSVTTTDTIVRTNASALPRLPRLHHPLLQRYPSSVGLAIQDRTVISAMNNQVLRRNNRQKRPLVLTQDSVLMIYPPGHPSPNFETIYITCT